MTKERKAAARRDLLDQLKEAVAEGAMDVAGGLLGRLHPAEIADALESVLPEQRSSLWKRLPAEQYGEVLLEANEDVRRQLIRETAQADLAAAVSRLDMDELADLYGELPAPVVEAVVQAMHVQRRQLLETLRAYPEDSAGGLMNVDTISVRADVTLDVVQRYLHWQRRRQGSLPESTDTLMVVDRDGTYLGLLPLIDVVSLDADLPVAQVMNRDVEGVPATLSSHKVARLFEDRNLVSAPVVDEAGKLLGRITVDDMVDVIRDEADRSVLAPAGLDEEADMFAPVWVSARRRALWLGVNLANAFVAAWVIGQFGGTIQQMVALAVLMPVVASMGGVAGNQTLTLVTRGIALDQVGRSNARELLMKELGVASINGALWAIVVGGVATAWFESVPLGLIFGTAIILNLVNGAAVGALIPLMLNRLGIDPALAGGVLLTALTDVVGFASFLSLATLFLV